jgi:hypothetical protein
MSRSREDDHLTVDPALANRPTTTSPAGSASAGMLTPPKFGLEEMQEVLGLLHQVTGRARATGRAAGGMLLERLAQAPGRHRSAGNGAARSQVGRRRPCPPRATTALHRRLRHTREIHP